MVSRSVFMVPMVMHIISMCYVFFVGNAWIDLRIFHEKLAIPSTLLCICTGSEKLFILYYHMLKARVIGCVHACTLVSFKSELAEFLNCLGW